MNTITITLTKSKSFIATDSNQPDRYMFEISNPSGTKVVTAENNSTEIKVIYPIEFAEYTKYVDMKNTRSATDGDRIYFEVAGTEHTFTIPDNMTFSGYTFLHFVATNGNDERAIWDRVAIKIWSTSPNWTGEAASQPDILQQALSIAQSVRDDADDGMFVGPIGPQGTGTATGRTTFAPFPSDWQGVVAPYRIAIYAREYNSTAQFIHDLGQTPFITAFAYGEGYTSNMYPADDNGTIIVESMIKNANRIVVDGGTTEQGPPGPPGSPGPEGPPGPAGESSSLYDIEIRTQAEFDALIDSATWLDAKSVLFDGSFVGLTGFIKSIPTGIKIPQTVLKLVGINKAKIVVNDFAYVQYTAQGALWYSSPTGLSTAICEGLEVHCNGATAYVFVDLPNIVNCTTGGGTGARIYRAFTFTGSGTQTITNCTTGGVGNAASDYFAFYNAGSGIQTITNCTTSGSAGSTNGYKYYAFYSTGSGTQVITNCTTSGTSSGSYASTYYAFYCDSSSTQRITNCTVSGNGIGGYYAFSCDATGVQQVSNCIVQGIGATKYLFFAGNYAGIYRVYANNIIFNVAGTLNILLNTSGHYIITNCRFPNRTMTGIPTTDTTTGSRIWNNNIYV